MPLCIWVFRPVTEPLLCKTPTLTTLLPILYFHCLYSSNFVSFSHSLVLSPSMSILNPLLNELEWYWNRGGDVRKGLLFAGGGKEEVGLFFGMNWNIQWKHRMANWIHLEKWQEVKNKEMSRVLEEVGLSEKRNWLRTQGNVTLSNTHSDGDGRKDNSRSYKAKRLSHKMPDSVPQTQDVMKTKQ